MVKKINLTKEFIMGLVVGMALVVFVFQAFSVWQIRSEISLLTDDLVAVDRQAGNNLQAIELLSQLMIEAGLVPDEYLQQQ